MKDCETIEEKSTIYLKFLGKPLPRLRARISKFGSYDPQHKEMKAFKSDAKAQMLELGHLNTPFDKTDPLKVDITFIRTHPKAWSKKKKERELYPITKPDLDNYIKFILDGLNEIAYHDDNQIAEIQAKKVYGSSEQTEIRVYLL